jgi:hypothetical protein
VLTTVWRGYSPLAGSTDDYRSQTRRSNGLFSRLTGRVSAIAPVLDQRPICESSQARILPLEQAQILDGELPDSAAFADRLNQLVLRGRETSSQYGQRGVD